MDSVYLERVIKKIKNKKLVSKITIKTLNCPRRLDKCFS